jgi:hypothetical protein
MMTNVYRSDSGSSALSGRVHVTSAIQVDGIAADAATTQTNAFIEAASAHDKERGPLQIDASYDAALRRLNIQLEGSVAATLHVLEAKTAQGQPVVDERTVVNTAAVVGRLHRHGASIIANHLMSAAQNHPQSDLPLRMENPYDEPQQRLTVRLSGSAFATSYLLWIVAVQMTQSSHIDP